MNDVQVTLVGTITSDIRFGTGGEVPVARFRIRAQSRRYNKTTNTWQDGEPSYYSAVAWRNLAEHVASSLGVGDPVLAHGRLRMARWRPDTDPTLSAEVELVSIGHDLRWGTTVYRKSQPPPLMRRAVGREVADGSGGATEQGPPGPDGLAAAARALPGVTASPNPGPTSSAPPPPFAPAPAPLTTPNSAAGTGPASESVPMGPPATLPGPAPARTPEPARGPAVSPASGIAPATASAPAPGPVIGPGSVPGPGARATVAPESAVSAPVPKPASAPSPSPTCDAPTTRHRRSVPTPLAPEPVGALSTATPSEHECANPQPDTPQAV